MSALQFGALAGLTVYAVPQVLAAAAPLGPTAVHMGTLVKLVRVLMLGPVCLLLALVAPRLHTGPDALPVAVSARKRPVPGRPPIHHLVPWFIIGFLVLMGLRTAGWVPGAMVAPTSHLATGLTVVSMAALGLGVDVRTVAGAGGRVTATVVLSLLTLGLISFALIQVLAIS